MNPLEGMKEVKISGHWIKYVLIFLASDNWKNGRAQVQGAGANHGTRVFQNVHGRSSIVAQWVKPWSATLTSHVGIGLSFSCFTSIYRSTSVPGKWQKMAQILEPLPPCGTSTVPTFWLWPGPARATRAIWIVKQQMQDISLSLFLSLSFSNK